MPDNLPDLQIMQYMVNGAEAMSAYISTAIDETKLSQFSENLYNERYATLKNDINTLKQNLNLEPELLQMHYDLLLSNKTEILKGMAEQGKQNPTQSKEVEEMLKDLKTAIDNSITK